MARENETKKSFGIKRRMTIVVAFITLAFFVVTASLAIVSIINHEKYTSIAISQQIRDANVTPTRGSIYDTNMNVLAESATVYTVALSPLDIKKENYDKIADGLSSILHVNRNEIYEQCQEQSYYSIVKRKVDQPVVEEIRNWMAEEKVGGITFSEDAKRYYPYGNFLSQVLGFVGTDNYGLSGLEAYYNDYLSGIAGRVITAQNAHGTETFYSNETNYEVTEGYSLVLTVDNVIQHYLESALDTAVREHNVKNRACGIVMNVNTGEVLAMATKGDFDPNTPFTVTDAATLEAIEAMETDEEKNNAYSAAQQLQWNNKAIQDTYEPGSVFKSITASTALETGAADLNSKYYCGLYYQVTDQIRMKCATRAHGWETFPEALVNSCNPAFIQIGQAIGSKNFFQYFQAFGLTDKTGIDLPGEANSIYYDEDSLGVVQLASCSYGQSNALTPIQMITAFSAVVNGGNLMQPYIVSEIIDDEGNTIESFEPTVKRQVISAETSATMCTLLEDVVKSSNGSNVYLAGYRVGGKSGTSQKLVYGEAGYYISSFIAFAPADDPQIAILILLDNAKSYSIYGSTLVGPIVQSVMADVLPYIGVERVYTDEEMQNIDVSVPNVMDYSLTQARSVLQRVGFELKIIGDGTSVTNQYPVGGQAVTRGSVVVLYTDNEEVKEVTVPDLTGRTIKSAENILHEMDLNIKVEGSNSSTATAISQSIEIGETVKAGTVITVTFIDNSLND